MIDAGAITAAPPRPPGKAVEVRANRTFARLVVLFMLYPPAFSIVFALIGIPLPTYLFCTLVAIVMLLTTNRFSLRIFPYFNRQSLLAMGLIGTIFISGAYTASPTAWIEKLVFIVYTILVPVVVLYAAFFVQARSPLTLHYLERSLYRHAIGLLWISSLCLILLGRPDNTGRLTMPGIENTIWVARYFGVLAIAVFCTAGRPSWRNPLHLMSMLLAMVDMLLAGSRGPLLALLVALIVFHYYHSGKSTATLVVAVVVGLLAVGYNTIGGYVFETGFYSLYERMDILAIFDGASSFPLGGFGVASFGVLTTGVDYLFYPHNLLAEIFFEQGVVGLVLLVALMAVVVRNFRFDIRGYLLIFFFINSLGSGDIPSNNAFFILVFLLALPMGKAELRKLLDKRAKRARRL